MSEGGVGIRWGVWVSEGVWGWVKDQKLFAFEIPLRFRPAKSIPFPLNDVCNVGALLRELLEHLRDWWQSTTWDGQLPTWQQMSTWDSVVSSERGSTLARQQGG